MPVINLRSILFIELKKGEEVDNGDYEEFFIPNSSSFKRKILERERERPFTEKEQIKTSNWRIKIT